MRHSSFFCNRCRALRSIQWLSRGEAVDASVVGEDGVGRIAKGPCGHRTNIVVPRPK